MQFNGKQVIGQHAYTHTVCYMCDGLRSTLVKSIGIGCHVIRRMRDGIKGAKTQLEFLSATLILMCLLETSGNKKLLFTNVSQ